MNPSSTPTSSITPYISEWFEGLAGRPLNTQDPNRLAAQREGILLRKILSQRIAPPEQDSMFGENIDEQWQKVLHQARKEGLFVKPQGVKSIWKRMTSSSNSSRYALAASVSAIALGLALLIANQQETDFQPDEVVMRGDESALRLQQADSESVLQLADNVEKILQSNKIAYNRTNLSNGRVQFQAKVASASNASHLLKQLGINAPEHGRLNLIIENIKEKNK